jgi:hypothetical protein
MRALRCLLLTACLIACGGAEGDAAPTCGVAGLTRECLETCDFGTQTCQLTGEWSECVCREGTAAADGGGASGTTAGTSPTAGGGSGTGAGSGAGTGSPQDAGFDATTTFDAASDLDAMLTDSGPSGPGLYERCTKMDKCQDGAMCHRSGLGGSMSGTCTVKCTSKADCPAPAGGTATTACSGSGVCQLLCSASVTCPVGLACVDLGAIGLCL